MPMLAIAASADADLVTAVELGLSEDDPTEFALVAGVVAERSGDLAEAGGYYRTFLDAVETERVAAGELALNAAHDCGDDCRTGGTSDGEFGR